MEKRKKTKIISCEEAMGIMFEYIDGVLAGKHHSELEQHVETCRGCLKKVEFQLKLKKRLTSVKPVSISKKLSKRLSLILEN